MLATMSRIVRFSWCIGFSVLGLSHDSISGDGRNMNGNEGGQSSNGNEERGYEKDFSRARVK